MGLHTWLSRLNQIEPSSLSSVVESAISQQLLQGLREMLCQHAQRMNPDLLPSHHHLFGILVCPRLGFDDQLHKKSMIFSSAYCVLLVAKWQHVELRLRTRVILFLHVSVVSVRRWLLHTTHTNRSTQLHLCTDDQKQFKKAALVILREHDSILSNVWSRNSGTRTCLQCSTCNRKTSWSNQLRSHNSLTPLPPSRRLCVPINELQLLSS